MQSNTLIKKSKLILNNLNYITYFNYKKKDYYANACLKSLIDSLNNLF